MEAALQCQRSPEELQALSDALQINPVTGLSYDFNNKFQDIAFYLEGFPLDFSLGYPQLPSYDEYVEWRITELLRNSQQAWLARLWDGIYATYDEMRDMYYEGLDDTTLADFNYLIMRINDMMEEFSVAIDKAKIMNNSETSSQEESSPQAIKDQFGPDLKKIIANITRRFFPEKTAQEVQDWVQRATLRLVWWWI